MFEEAQLYSPVTTAEDGSVTVHLSDDHPGKTDPDYAFRKRLTTAKIQSLDVYKPVAKTT